MGVEAVEPDPTHGSVAPEEVEAQAPMAEDVLDRAHAPGTPDREPDPFAQVD